MADTAAQPGSIETITVPAQSAGQPQQMMFPMATTDPFLFLLQLPLLPLMMFMQMQMSMMKSMSFGTQASNLKIVTLRRDAQGNIIEIMERG
jgi:hypothetical protein